MPLTQETVNRWMHQEFMEEDDKMTDQKKDDLLRRLIPGPDGQSPVWLYPDGSHRCVTRFDVSDINAALAITRAQPVAEDAKGDEFKPTHRHKKRGTLYEKVGNAQFQTDKPVTLNDYFYLIVYKGEDGSLWVRTTPEFIDGRFEEIAPQPEHEGE